MAVTQAAGLADRAAGMASGLVGAGFSEARTYAASAWVAAQAALAALSSFAGRPEIDTVIEVDFNYSGGDIISAVLADKPESPDIEFDVSGFDVPTPGALKDLPAFDGVVSSLRVALAAKITALVADGATGLDASVEAAIWERMKSRQEVDNLRLYTEVEQFFSARGFVLPPGAMGGRLTEAGIEIARNNSYLNNDIVVEQARLAQANTHWVLEKGVLFVLEDMKLMLTSIVEYNKDVIAEFAAKIEAFKQRLSVEIARIDALAKKYTAEAEVYKAGAILASVDLEAQAKNAELNLKKAEVEATLRIKAAEIELDLLQKVHTLQVEAMKASGQIAAQITASALSSVNATASVGFSGGANLSHSEAHSYDETKSVESGPTTQNIHSYDETAATA